MAQCFRPFPFRFSGLALGCGVAAAWLTAFTSPAQAATKTVSSAAPFAVPSALAAELCAQPDADAAEMWLAQTIPTGTALADAPDFFAAASEIFYEADEGLVVFVYRSADRGRWIAWVSFDGERVAVVHTAAIAL